MELLQIDEIELDTQFLIATFDGLFDTGFYIETEYDFDKIREQQEETEVNLKEHYIPENITFWNWKAFNSNQKKISINNRETKKIKQMVENELTNILIKHLND